MRKQVIRIVLIFVLVGIITSVVDASFSAGNLSHTIDTSYGPGEYVTGWINISFTNELGDKLFKDSKNTTIRLIDLLKNQTEYDYTCSPSSCKSAYAESNSNSIKSFSLSSGQDKLLGIKLTGKIQGVTNISFKIESNAEASCYNQIKIDFLNDGVYEKGNSKSESSGNCEFLKRYGCFNSSKTTEPKYIGQTPYCQRIELTESPGFNLGAWVKKSGANASIFMVLKNLYGDEVAGTNCKLPAASETGSEISCSINFSSIKPEEYYACIYSDRESDYNTLGYDDSNGCGFYGENVQDEVASYKIFVEGKRFNGVGNLTVDDALLNDNTISAEIEDYISSTYGNSDCSKGCIIPIKIKSNVNQNIKLSDLNLKYSTLTGSSTADVFYDLTETAPFINSKFGKLSLDNAKFIIPNVYGNYTFELKLDNTKIFSQKIYIENVPQILSIKPGITVSGLPTEFSIKSNSSSSITQYYWKFGDGQDEITSTNKITHTYNSTGKYNLEVELTDSNERSSKRIFVIIVGNPKETIKEMLDSKKKDLESVKADILKFDEFSQKQLNILLNTDEINTELKNIQKKYESTYTETGYTSLVREIFDLKVPSDIQVSRKGDNLIFFPNTESIDLEVLTKIREGNYDASKENLFKQAILDWNAENLETKISFQEISGTYESEIEPIGTFYTIKINKLTSSDNPYFIIKNLKGLTFAENYLENSESGYTSIELKQDSQTIGFLTEESIDFSELPLFISPEINRLSLLDIKEAEKKPLMIGWLSFSLFLILLIGAVIYIILQEWYKRKYENYLFRNRTNLYNLINYIDNAKRNDISEWNISGKLNKVGWSSEQTTYALRKYSGKRTGMVELFPIDRLFSIFSKKPAILEPPRSVQPNTLPPRIPFGMQKRIIPQNNRQMFFKK